MPPKSVTDLAQALPDGERRELLARIQKSLSLAQGPAQGVIKSRTPQEQKLQMIHEGIAKLGFIQRVKLWFIKMLGNKTTEDAYLDMRMGEMAKALESQNLADPVARSVEADFARIIWRLYLSVLPIRNFVGHVWSNEDDLRGAIQFVIENRVPKARVRLYDFLPLDEIQMLFEMSESKGSIRQELMARINGYIEGIPLEIFTEIEQGIMPLYHIRSLCFFDYTELLRQFGVDARAMDKGSPEFRSTSIDRVLEPLENLYNALHSARKAASLDVLPPQLYKFVQNRRLAQTAEAPPPPSPEGMFTPPEEGPVPDMVSPAVLEEGLRQLRKDLKTLHEAITMALDQSRITELIKFFNNDPYYRFIAYVPNLNLKDFYVSTLRFQVLSELDGEFSSIRRQIVKNLYQDLFPKGGITFDFFQRYPFGEPRGGISGFRYVTSLEYLHSFLTRSYGATMRDALRGVIKSLPNRNRDTGSELLFHTTGLETIAEKLKILDASFSPDTEEGKSFQRMKYALDKDVAQEKQYRVFIIQRDKDNREILEEAVEHLAALATALDEVLGVAPALLAERFSRASLTANPTQFIDFLRGVVVKLRKTGRLVRYQRALDDETY